MCGERIAIGLRSGATGVMPACIRPRSTLDVTRYVHYSGRFRDGFARSEINSIAQTLRFDGIKAVPWRPPSGQPLPSGRVFRVLPARDGTLWIGTTSGLASWKDGKFTQYPELAGLAVDRIVQDREGVIWVGAEAATGFGMLCEIRNDRFRCSEGSEIGLGVFDLYVIKLAIRGGAHHIEWAARCHGETGVVPSPNAPDPGHGSDRPGRGFRI
jgi:hypothetical protein